MNKLLIPALAAALLTGAALPAAAAPAFVSVNARAAELDHRIDMGVRNHSLTPREAARLRADLRDIERQEARDRASRPGLTGRERAELDRRFDALSARVRIDRHDRDFGQNFGPRHL